MDHYEVKNTDTLEGIAAAHDCTVGELVKLNKLHCRMVIFPFSNTYSSGIPFNTMKIAKIEHSQKD